MSNITKLQKIRDAMNGRIGEIIAAVIGDDQIQKLYDGKTVPATLKGRSSAEVALGMGVISSDIKTALLMAQAAEHTYRLAVKTDKVARILQSEKDDARAKFKKFGKDKAEEMRAAGFPVNMEQAGYIGLNAAVFKYVGSDKDADVLKAAQGACMAAQIYLNNEIGGVNDYAQNPSGVGGPSLMGPEYADGFKKAAMRNYRRAADLLEKEGYKEEAVQFREVADDIDEEIINDNAPHPSTFLQKHLATEKQAHKQAGTPVPKVYEERIEKLVKLTELIDGPQETAPVMETPVPAAGQVPATGIKKAFKPGL